MDTYSLLGYLFGMALGMPFAFFLGVKRRAKVPRFVWWLCIAVGIIPCFSCMSITTSPSFARRILIVGRASGCVEHRVGRSSKFSFLISPESGGAITLETRIPTPGWGSPTNFDGRILKITYLDDTQRQLSNEAIDVAILYGEAAGWHKSLDARPFGLWLGIPLGAFLVSVGFFGHKFRADDLRET